MPEIPFSKTPATVQATDTYNISRPDIEREALASEGLEWLGGGKDRLVFVDPGNPNKAIALARSSEELEFSPRWAKQLFYLHNIFSTLFPHNFPHIYAAHGSIDSEALDIKHPGTVRERVLTDEKYLYERRSPIQYPFSRVKRLCKYWEIPLMVEDAPHNYMVSKDGGEYYVDMFLFPESQSQNYEGLDTILTYMNRGKGNYSDSDKAKVERYIQRLHAVQEEMEPRDTPELEFPIVTPTLLTSDEDISRFLEERKQRIEIGGKSKEQLLREMELADITISGDARACINSSKFTLPTAQGIIKVVRLSVADLMQSSEPATITKIYEKMGDLGLEECPDELALDYRCSSDAQPQEGLYFGNRPISFRGHNRIFRLISTDQLNRGGKLDCFRVDADWKMFEPENEFIFKAPAVKE